MNTIDTEDARRIWSQPAEHVGQRIRWTFVLITCAMAAVATLSLITLGTQIATLFAASATVAEGGFVYIIAVFATFLSFVLVVGVRLLQLEGDRLLNSMSIAMVYTAVALVLALITMAVDAASNGGWWLPGVSDDALGMVWVAFLRTAPAALVACLLAASVLPARGRLPRGTQTDVVSTDHQL